MSNDAEFDPAKVERYQDSDARHDQPHPPVYVRASDYNRLLEMYRAALSAPKVPHKTPPNLPDLL